MPDRLDRTRAPVAVLSLALTLHAGAVAAAEPVADMSVAAAEEVTEAGTRVVKQRDGNVQGGIFLLGGLALGAVAVGALAAGGGSVGDGGGGDATNGLADRTKTYDGTRTAVGIQPSGDPAAYRTSEFRGNYSLGLIGAEYRYADGAYGTGTLGAILDTGADYTHPEFAGRIRRDLSFDYYTRSNDVRDVNGHGTHVAGILGAARDGAMMHGVAWDADLMILKGFGDPYAPAIYGYPSVFGDAMSRAAHAGATAMNNSWSYVADQTNRTSMITDFDTRREFERFLGGAVVNALGDARDADMITVFATANDGLSEVSSTAGLPVLMPEFQNYWIAVTSVDRNGLIAASANRCGTAMDFCLAAPGDRILSVASTQANFDADSYVLQSGTSMAAPHVTGAVLLLKSQFPELTGPEIQRILFETATDLGAPGTDAVYGRGLLNLERAMAPSGPLSIPTASTMGGGSQALAGSMVGESAAFAGVFGTALAGRDAMATDAYDRGYGLRMASMVAPSGGSLDARRRADAFAMGGAARTIEGDGQRLTLGTRATAPAAMANAETFATPYDAYAGRDLRARWEGEMAPGLALTFGAATGAGEGNLVSVGLDVTDGPVSLSFEVGTLQETGRVLGTSFEGALGGDNTSSTTRYGRIGGAMDVAGGTTLHAAASLGISDFTSGGMVTGGSDIRSSALAVGASRAAAGGTLSIGLSRPLAVTGGEMRLDRPVALTASEGGVRTNTVTRVEETVPLAAATRPTELSVGYARDVLGGEARIGGIVELADRPGAALSAGWRIRF